MARQQTHLTGDAAAVWEWIRSHGGAIDESDPDAIVDFEETFLRPRLARAGTSVQERLDAVLALHAPKDDPLPCLRHANRHAVGWREATAACPDCFAQVRQVCRSCGSPTAYPCLTASAALGTYRPALPPVATTAQGSDA